MTLRVLLSAPALLLLAVASVADARPFRVAQVPNGASAQCLTCHVYPGGPRNAFGLTVESYGGIGFLDGPGGNVQWGTVTLADPAHPSEPPKTLAALDSDGDGRANGEELLDPAGAWRPGQPNPGDSLLVRMPGVVDSVVVIRQVFAGGGGPGALYQRDYVELFNRSSAPVSLAGWSLQSAAPTGAGNFGSTAARMTPLPAVVLEPGQSFLVEGASGAGAGSVLPTPALVDATPLELAEAGGKLALVRSTAPVACNGDPAFCTPAMTAQFVDLVGYGASTFYEGVSQAPALSTTSALVRAQGGCRDIDSNGSNVPPVVGDFTLGMPTPRGTASPAAPCVPLATVPTVPALSWWALGVFALALLGAGTGWSVRGGQLPRLSNT